jgi:hydroxymethylpyrimidine pyrophosphatase-like HAD family hydrolase
MSKYKNKKLIALDLDGTLTQHKSRLDSRCRAVLEKLMYSHTLLMVCAGACERVYRQMEGFPINIAGHYGMQLSSIENGTLKIIENHVVPVDRQITLQRAEMLRDEFGFLDYDGDSIEFHDSGMITFPILGTSAAPDKKLAYDPHRQKRRRYYQRVCEVFGDYTVFIGGTSSFDIAPRPYCKLHALEGYIHARGMNSTDAVYFGDDYGMGGNDRDIYDSDIDFICIDDYRDFPAIAERLLLG